MVSHGFTTIFIPVFLRRDDPIGGEASDRSDPSAQEDQGRQVDVVPARCEVENWKGLSGAPSDDDDDGDDDGDDYGDDDDDAGGDDDDAGDDDDDVRRRRRDNKDDGIIWCNNDDHNNNNDNDKVTIVLFMG